MSFCDNCGFLLPADVKGNDNGSLCKPCRQASLKSPGPKVCDCEICYNPLSTPVPNYADPNIIIVSEEEDSREETDQLMLDKEADNKSEEHRPNSWDMDLFFDIEDNEIESHTSHTNFVISDDVDIMEDDDWTVCTRKSHRHKGQKAEKREKVYIGLTEDVKGKLEDQVAEEIRTKWTQEQAEYFQKLITEDTPAIASLTSGKRWKSNGSRFYVGGVDISFIKGNKVDACACLSVVQMPNLEMVYQRMEMIKLTQPYIPGFLAFREVPPLLTLFKCLEKTAPHFMPDVVMVDGNGILHPRGFGLASHLGVVLDIPTIGVAKTLISAQGISEDADHKMRKQMLQGAGHGFDLISQETGKVLGKCVQVHDDAPNPIYVSIGHKISLSSAVWIVLETSKYRIPEPVRRADLDSREYIRQRKKNPEEFILR